MNSPDCEHREATWVVVDLNTTMDSTLLALCDECHHYLEFVVDLNRESAGLARIEEPPDV